MIIPSQLREKLINRFENLIAQGEQLLSTTKVTEKFVSINSITGIVRTKPVEHVDFSILVKWRTDCALLLTMLFPIGHVHNCYAASFNSLGSKIDNIKWGISTLRSLKENLEDGFLEDLSMQISAGIASDYMGQAEALLAEGHLGKFGHVPAAVLSGAVLERALKILCTQQQQPISLTRGNGVPKTLNPLIDDLKKAAVFNEAKAKQLRVWVYIRNHAAHGDFEQFTCQDVEEMIRGVKNFLDSYLK